MAFVGPGRTGPGRFLAFLTLLVTLSCAAACQVPGTTSGATIELSAAATTCPVTGASLAVAGPSVASPSPSPGGEASEPRTASPEPTPTPSPAVVEASAPRTAGASPSPAAGTEASGPRTASPSPSPTQPVVATEPRLASPSPSLSPQASPSAQPPARPPFTFPTSKGLNYGGPHTQDGRFLGTRWLRPGDPGWASAKPALAADLDFIRANDLGRVARIFVGIDQLMVWDDQNGFVRFDDASMANLTEALDMFDARGIKVIAVVFDQEEVSSPGNFRFQALDGRHPAMRRNYLSAVDQFLRRFGGRSTVIGWDLFNEAYGSLSRLGGLPPAGRDPISPGYSEATVHDWMRDLYQTARCAAPQGWYTVSDSIELYWHRPPDLSRYDDSVDFYDIHVYSDNPEVPDWGQTLHKPFVLGEVGAGINDNHFLDQTYDARAVSFWLCNGRSAGASAVFVHTGGGDVVFPLDRSHLTRTGDVVAAAEP
jgi:hypothetical protein